MTHTYYNYSTRVTRQTTQTYTYSTLDNDRLNAIAGILRRDHGDQIRWRVCPTLSNLIFHDTRATIEVALFVRNIL